MKLIQLFTLALAILAFAACASVPPANKEQSEVANETADEALKRLHDAPVDDDGSAFRVLTVKGKDMDPATVAAAQNSLDSILAERKDLKVREDGRSTIEVTLSPFEKNAYMVTLWVKRFTKDGTSSSLVTKMKTFRIRPGENLKPELARKLKILVPPPKHAEPHPNDLTPDEVDAGYKKIHDKLHKPKK